MRANWLVTVKEAKNFSDYFFFVEGVVLSVADVLMHQIQSLHTNNLQKNEQNVRKNN